MLLRADFNVPLQEGRVSDDTRIRKTLPTIQYLLDRGASIAICSHLGRPEGKPNMKYSLLPVAEHLEKLLVRPVRFLPNPIDNKNLEAGEVIVLQNTRFFEEEKEDKTIFAGALARGCDLFVNDAFGAIHRSHASTLGVAGLLPAYAGLLVEREVEVLSEVMKNPERPLALVLGGAKMKTKIGVLEYFAEKADVIMLGGGIANTFLAAKGADIGDSLFEPLEVEHAKRILEKAEQHGKIILLPEDAVVAHHVDPNAETAEKDISTLEVTDKILDIGPKTREQYVAAITSAKTFLWNGPVGIFEMQPFAEGTRAVAEAATTVKKSILGGGDTLEALSHFGHGEEEYFHASTGGGAMLQFLEGATLPALDALQDL